MFVNLLAVSLVNHFIIKPKIWCEGSEALRVRVIGMYHDVLTFLDDLRIQEFWQEGHVTVGYVNALVILLFSKLFSWNCLPWLGESVRCWFYLQAIKENKAESRSIQFMIFRQIIKTSLQRNFRASVICINLNPGSACLDKKTQLIIDTIAKIGNQVIICLTVSDRLSRLRFAWGSGGHIFDLN